MKYESTACRKPEQHNVHMVVKNQCCGEWFQETSTPSPKRLLRSFKRNEEYKDLTVSDKAMKLSERVGGRNATKTNTLQGRDKAFPGITQFGLLGF